MVWGKVFSWTPGFRRYHMRFMMVLEWLGVGFAWFCFSLLSSWPQNSLFSTLSLCELFHVGPGVQYTESRSWGLLWRADCLIWLLIVCLFRRRRWGGACPGDRLHVQSHSFYFVTVHLFICQMLSNTFIMYIHVLSLCLSLSHTQTHEELYGPHFISYSFIYTKNEDLSMKWKCTKFR